MASSTVRLPAVFAVTSSASRMGTPEEIIVPSVRVKRATATLRITAPISGIFRITLSRILRPLGLL